MTYTPYRLEFLQEDGGRAKEQEVEFRNTGEEEYELEILDYPRKLFQVKLSSTTLKPKNEIQLKVKPVKSLPPGTVKGSVTLKIKGKEEFRITIPIKKETALPVKGK